MALLAPFTKNPRRLSFGKKMGAGKYYIPNFPTPIFLPKSSCPHFPAKDRTASNPPEWFVAILLPS
jgi:hypothetical protein